MIDGHKNTFFLTKQPLDFSRYGALYWIGIYTKCLQTRGYIIMSFIAHSNSGVSLNNVLINAAGYLPPCTSASSTTLLTSAFSSSVSFTFKAPQFSSRYLILLVPGMGMISSPCANSHASVSCPGVTFFFFAISASFSTNCIFLGKFSSENRGATRRKSPSSKSVRDLYCPVRKPRPRGL